MNRKNIIGSMAAGLSLFAIGMGANAASIVKCVDSEGQVYFADKCPEATELVDKRSISGKVDGSAELQRLAKENPVLLYSTDNCDACELMRIYLEKRGTPFTEKSVATDAESQAELKEKTGLLQVPVVYVGEKLISGVNRTALKDALDTAGYPDENQPDEGEKEEEKSE